MATVAHTTGTGRGRVHHRERALRSGSAGVLAVLALVAAGPAHAQQRVGVHVAGDGAVIAELEAATRAACVVRGLELVPADEVRSAIHFTAPSGALDEPAAARLAGVLGASALVLVNVEGAADSPTLLLRIRIAAAGPAPLVTRYGEATRDTAAERIAQLLRDAFSVRGVVPPAALTVAAAPPIVAAGTVAAPLGALAPEPPAPPRVASAASVSPAPEVAITPENVRLAVRSEVASQLVVRLTAPDGSTLSSLRPSERMLISSGPTELRVEMQAHAEGMYALCIGLNESAATAVRFDAEVDVRGVHRRFQGERSTAAPDSACSTTSEDFVGAFRARPSLRTPSVAATATREAALELDPRSSATVSLENRGSARVCRVLARNGSENEIEVLSDSAEPIEPRATASLRIPRGRGHLDLYSCRGQRLSGFDVAGDERDSYSTDYTELGHYPVYLRLAVGLYTFNVWVPQYAAVGYGFWPAATFMFGYALEPGGVGIGLLARLGAVVAGGPAGCCGAAFGGMFLAGVSTPSGVFGAGVALQNDAPVFVIGSEYEVVRFSNDFFLTGSGHIGITDAGAFSLVYGLGLGLGGSIL